MYLVYNEILNGHGKGNPEIPFSDYRAVVVKYVHTFYVGR
jgi:hypothetical protein